MLNVDDTTDYDSNESVEMDKEIDIKEGVLTGDKVNDEARKNILKNLNRSHQFKPS